MEEVDWLSVREVLETLLENIRSAESELCSLRFFDGVRALRDNVEVFVREMITDVEKREQEEARRRILGYEYEYASESESLSESESFGESFGEETELPPRGYGLTAGTAARSIEERRMGHPRTEEERMRRHKTLFGV